MDGWITLWKVLFFGGISAFAVMSVWVAIAGVGDIRRMFRDLAAGRDRDEK